MEIKRIKILYGHGPDTVLLETDLPEASWPYEGPLSVRFHCAQESAETYVKQHFPNLPVVKVPRVK